MTNNSYYSNYTEAQEAPIHLAAKNGHKDVVELLLSYNADVDAINNIGKTALQYAEEEGYDDIADLLRHTVQGLEHRDNDADIPTALHGDVDLVDEGGNTMLHLAAHFGSSTFAIGLLNNGANANAQNNDEKTPLHYAAQNGHEAVVEMLLNQEGIDINARDDK